MKKDLAVEFGSVVCISQPAAMRGGFAVTVGSVMLQSRECHLSQAV
jgi:hypothetical protein